MIDGFLHVGETISLDRRRKATIVQTRRREPVLAGSGTNS